MTPVIIIHPTAGPCPVTPAPDTPELQREMAKEWRRQADVSLARIMSNPVPKGQTYE